MNKSLITNKPSADLLATCPRIEKDGKYGTFGEVMQKLLEVTDMYIECAKRHNGLAELLKESK